MCSCGILIGEREFEPAYSMKFSKIVHLIGGREVVLLDLGERVWEFDKIEAVELDGEYVVRFRKVKE